MFVKQSGLYIMLALHARWSVRDIAGQVRGSDFMQATHNLDSLLASARIHQKWPVRHRYISMVQERDLFAPAAANWAPIALYIRHNCVWPKQNQAASNSSWVKWGGERNPFKSARCARICCRHFNIKRKTVWRPVGTLLNFNKGMSPRQCCSQYGRASGVTVCCFEQTVK